MVLYSSLIQVAIASSLKSGELNLSSSSPPCLKDKEDSEILREVYKKFANEVCNAENGDYLITTTDRSICMPPQLNYVPYINLVRDVKPQKNKNSNFLCRITIESLKKEDVVPINPVPMFVIIPKDVVKALRREKILFNKDISARRAKESEVGLKDDWNFYDQISIQVEGKDSPINVYVYMIYRAMKGKISGEFGDLGKLLLVGGKKSDARSDSPETVFFFSHGKPKGKPRAPVIWKELTLDPSAPNKKREREVGEEENPQEQKHSRVSYV